MSRRTIVVATGWALGGVIMLLAVVALALLLADLVAFDGTCSGSLLPFIGAQASRPCGFGEYFAAHGGFTLQVLVMTSWPIALLFVVVAVLVAGRLERGRRGGQGGGED